MACVIGANLRFIRWIDQVVVRGHAEVGRALEHCELRRFLRQQLDALEARRPGANHRHAFAVDFDRIMRPAPGLNPASGEILQTGNLRFLGH